MRADDPGKRFIGWVSAGFPSPALDYAEEDIDITRYLMPNETSIYFARVDGNSMLRSNIPHKSLVVIDKSLKPKDGSIVVAVLDGARIIKQLAKTHAGTFLSPSNPVHKPIRITDDMKLEIWGVVTHVIIDVINGAQP
jgi:DNA polymerase V